ncbi:MAG: DUF134 domain-containing protein [Pelovirga sp.]
MSPRPKKHRHCSCPHRPTFASVYKPAGISMNDLSQVFLPADELEALRLCDGLGLTQEEAGEKMGISRGTVQRLVSTGRKKLINAIAAGQALIIETALESASGETRD